jgi:hypothetical protein
VSTRPPTSPPSTFGPGERANPVPRLALSVDECCASLGCSWDFWNEHVAGEVKVVRRGRRKLIPIAELQRWLDENAELLLETRR